jgi:CheY-like chemotaxis protein
MNGGWKRVHVNEVKEMQPDLVVMDKNPGWADGCDRCALIKSDKDLQHIPVISFLLS